MSATNDIPVVYYEPNDVVFNNEDLCYAVKLEIEVLQRGFGETRTFTARFVSKTKNIDMIGGSNGVLTTSYTDVSPFEIENGGNTESLGVETINIKYNSWYFPEVSIKFVDIRGNAVFNPKERQNDNDNNGSTGSFFNALFMFPYPIYKLTVKGYYGKPVTYKLTVRDMKAAFNNNTGNFEINVDFIGHAYGYLVDIPMRALFLAPSIDYEGLQPTSYLGSFINGEDAGNSIPTFTQVVKDMYAVELMKTTDEDYVEAGTEKVKLNTNLQLYKDIKFKYNSILSFIASALDSNVILPITYDGNKTKFILKSGDKAEDFKTFNQNIKKYAEGIDETIRQIEMTKTVYDTNIEESIANTATSGAAQAQTTSQYGEATNEEQTTDTNPSGNTYDVGNVKIKPSELKIELTVGNGSDFSEIQHLSQYYEGGGMLNIFTPLNSIFSINTISQDGVTNDSFLMVKVDKIIKEHEELLKAKDKQQDSVMKSFYTISMGWVPTINNVFEIVLAHLDRFHACMQKCITNIEVNQSSRVFETQNTDCNSRGSTISLPPFPAFYNENNQHAWCGDIITSTTLSEEKLVDAFFSAATEVQETLQAEIDSYLSYTNAVQTHPRGFFIPTLLYDLKNGTNAYLKCDSVSELLNPLEGDTIPYCFRIFTARLMMHRLYNWGDYNRLSSAKEFGILEAYNVLRGQYDPRNLTHSVWTDEGFDFTTEISKSIAHYMKENNYGYGTPFMNDIDVKWDGETYKIIAQDEEDMMLCDWKKNDYWTFKRTMLDKNFSQYIPTEQKYKQIMDPNIYHMVSGAGCNLDNYKKVFPDQIPIRYPVTVLQNVGDPTEYVAFINKANTITFYHAFNETNKIIAALKNEDMWIIGGVKWGTGGDLDGDFECEGHLYSCYHEDETTMDDVNNLLYSLSCGLTNTSKNRYRYRTYGGVYKVPSLFLMALGYYYMSSYCAPSEYPLYAIPVSDYYDGDDFFYFAKQYYLDNRNRFLNEFKEVRKRETSGTYYKDDVEKDYEFNGSTECWEFYYEGRKYSNVIRNFLVKWATDYVFIYNAHGCQHLGYSDDYVAHSYTTNDGGSQQYNAALRHRINFSYENAGITTLQDWGDCQTYFEVSDAVNGFVDTIRSLCNVVVASDTVDEIPPPPIDITVDRKLAMYDMLKQLYDRWKIGDRDSKVEMFSPSSIGTSFIFRDTFNNEIGNDIMIDMNRFIGMLFNIINGTDNDMSVYSFLNQVCNDAHCLMLSLPTNVFSTFSNEAGLKDLFTPYPFASMNTPVTNTFIITYNHKYAQHLSYPEGESAYRDDGVDFRNHIVRKNRAGDNNKLGAFGVTYALDKQRFFNNIQVSMHKPQVTEQSLAALLTIANSGSSNGGINYTFDHHDLYDTYSQNSYTCEVEMMGNAQLMPMMYFQLNNIPLFKGGYLIIGAEHSIGSGGMKTSFKGVKVSKYQFDFSKMATATALRFAAGDGQNTSGYTPNSYPSGYEGKQYRHVSFKSFVNTSQTDQNGNLLPNNPTDPTIIENIFKCMDFIEKVADKWAEHCDTKGYGPEVERRLIVSSCYRSEAVNTKIGGATNSAHKIGAAVDFYVHYVSDIETRKTYNKELFNDVIIPMFKAEQFLFDQLINEYNYKWVHIGLKNPSGGGHRKQVLAITDAGTTYSHNPLY